MPELCGGGMIFWCARAVGRGEGMWERIEGNDLGTGVAVAFRIVRRASRRRFRIRKLLIERDGLRARGYATISLFKPI